jgi:hypothetical protein
MLRFMNLIQVESFAKVLNQIICDDRTSVVFKRFVVPNQLERFLFMENLLRVFLLAMLQPFVFSPSPSAVMPNLSHEAASLLVDTLFVVPLH